MNNVKVNLDLSPIQYLLLMSKKDINISTNPKSTKIITNGKVTGKSLSEALIFASTNPQYDTRLFIDLQVQYMKIPSSEHGENKGRTCKQHVLNMFSSCSPHVLSLEFLCIELVNL